MKKFLRFLKQLACIHKWKDVWTCQQIARFMAGIKDKDGPVGRRCQKCGKKESFL